MRDRGIDHGGRSVGGAELRRLEDALQHEKQLGPGRSHNAAGRRGVAPNDGWRSLLGALDGVSLVHGLAEVWGRLLRQGPERENGLVAYGPRQDLAAVHREGCGNCPVFDEASAAELPRAGARSAAHGVRAGAGVVSGALGQHAVARGRAHLGPRARGLRGRGPDARALRPGRPVRQAPAGGEAEGHIGRQHPVVAEDESRERRQVGVHLAVLGGVEGAAGRGLFHRPRGRGFARPATSESSRAPLPSVRPLQRQGDLRLDARQAWVHRGETSAAPVRSELVHASPRRIWSDGGQGQLEEPGRDLAPRPAIRRSLCAQPAEGHPRCKRR
mmetsp:Transcript_84908/g.239026  ORF Transcript_84908/g.239026 Transcript_84908/m.239026 type:complete len:329 (-) Transcript_84908:833-1819(-)